MLKPIRNSSKIFIDRRMPNPENIPMQGISFENYPCDAGFNITTKLFKNNDIKLLKSPSNQEIKTGNKNLQPKLRKLSNQGIQMLLQNRTRHKLPKIGTLGHIIKRPVSQMSKKYRVKIVSSIQKQFSEDIQIAHPKDIKANFAQRILDQICSNKEERKSASETGSRSKKKKRIIESCKVVKIPWKIKIKAKFNPKVSLIKKQSYGPTESLKEIFQQLN